MVTFLAIVPLLLFNEQGTALIWTMIIPLLPIGLLLIGFSRWRDICPLAMVSKISQRMNFIQKRKVPEWFEKNFWNLQYFFLFLGLTLRLTILNFNEFYLAYFFIYIALMAFVVNLIFTGKSWCNFFCPVAPVEKIYAISNAKNYMNNSACGSCTACKKSCPDIDLESNYWKEGADTQKSFVFYSFPGMILGFYTYFYLYAGSFDYYFSREWTNDDLSLLEGGFYFLPIIPVFIAAPLTLAVFAGGSFYLFKLLERYLWKRRVIKNANFETVSHIVKTIASFVAFNLFYVFAGAPSYSNYPTLYAIFYFLVVALSSILLYKEIFREEAFFIQERFALKIIKNWNSTKAIPSNLKEIYYTYINDSHTKKDRLKTYSSSITDLMQDGILNQNSMKILDKLREQIGVSQIEHENIMRTIRLKHENLFDDSIEKSLEKKRQQKSYKEVIENALNDHVELDKSFLRPIQKQFCISDEVHKEIMNCILNENEEIHQKILQSLEKIHNLIELDNSIFEDETREIYFLKYNIKNEFTFTSKDLFSMLFPIYEEHQEILKTILNISKGKPIEDSFIMNDETLSFMEEEIKEKILVIYRDFTQCDISKKRNNNEVIISQLLLHESIHIATAALLCTKKDTTKYFTSEVIEKFSSVEDIEVRAVLYKLMYDTERITIYEKMVYLNTIPIFKNLKFHDLHLLGQSTKVAKFQKDEYIIEQNGIGTTLFALIKGTALVEVDGINTAKLSHRDYFGEIALLGDIKRTASVKVVDDITALTITKKQFKVFLENNPEVSTQVIKEIIKKLR
ncbi:MAG: cyclic nucleotide-binding domain-containing protein [Campylobacterota bacterium]|nr:cyclic nucleotide-binding domain-containing protein [Campylobacterota bacterium]